MAAELEMVVSHGAGAAAADIGGDNPDGFIAIFHFQIPTCSAGSSAAEHVGGYGRDVGPPRPVLDGTVVPAFPRFKNKLRTRIFLVTRIQSRDTANIAIEKGSREEKRREA
jgi:hypothetical protein